MPKNNRTVLVIEDDDAVLYYLRVVLEKFGLAVVGAQDGGRGLELAERHRPDLVISDHHMPGTTGLQVLEQLRREPATQAVPFLLISVDPSSALKQRTLAAGGNGFLEKPFAPEQLIERVAALLDGVA